LHINVTLVIQVFNFLITYWFLKKFFFTPVLCALEQKRDQQNSLITQVNNEELILKSLEAEKLRTLLSFQQNFKDKYLLPPLTLPKISESTTLHYQPKEFEDFSKKMKEYLFKKVSHGY